MTSDVKGVSVAWCESASHCGELLGGGPDQGVLEGPVFSAGAALDCHLDKGAPVTDGFGLAYDKSVLGGQGVCDAQPDEHGRHWMSATDNGALAQKYRRLSN